MRTLIQIVSAWTWATGTILSVAARITPIIDDSIGIVAGLIGIAAGTVLLITSLIKRKQAKIELEIKEIELAQIKKINDKV